MKLLHGTSAANTDSILMEGLKPRNDRIGNWFRWYQQPSIPNLVYLTSKKEQADFHAMRTALLHQSDCVVLEADVSADNLYPDENLFQLTQIVNAKEMRGMQELALISKDRWEESLKKCALVAHDGDIPIDHITIQNTYPIDKSIYYGFVKHCAKMDVDAFDKSFGAYLKAASDGFFVDKVITFPDGYWEIDMSRVEVLPLHNGELEVRWMY